MMEARRRMMEAVFPGNYIFKEGRGLREGLSYDFYEINGAGGTLDDKSIRITGGNKAGYLLIANTIDWKLWANYSNPSPDDSYVIDSESLDLREYSTLYVEAKCRSNLQYKHIIGVLNEFYNGASGQLTRARIASLTADTAYWSAVEAFYDQNEERQVYALDISGVDIGTVAIKSGGTDSMYNEIYNIWME